MPTNAELSAAAGTLGVQQEFWDGFGRHHITTPETNAAIIAAMAPADKPTLLPPVIVISESDAGAFSDGPFSSGLITVEDGTTLQAGDKLPCGYHQLTTDAGTARLIVTPESACPVGQGRRTGLGVMLYGLRSGRNWGCGDFRDLTALIDWAVTSLNASFIALNPLHAIHNRRPYNTSPYLPNSIFYRNFLYLDVEAVPGFNLIKDRVNYAEEAATLRASSAVDYEAVATLKRRALELIFEACPPDESALEWICAEGDLLRLYATHCALDEHIHAAHPDIWIWPDWPAEYQSPDHPAVQRFAAEHAREIIFHGWLQWLIDQQLEGVQRHALAAGMSIGLYHDLALATDRCGADLWAYRDFFIPGCRVGSPPDDFSPTGQDWSFPPPNSQRHRQDGYRLFAQSIRKSLRHGGALRIDHVMRLFRLYWIPPGRNAMEGAYVRDHAEELVRILALESRRAGSVIIGEDLGTVEPGVRETLAQFGILSYRLLYFEREGETFKQPAVYPQLALVSTTTHDLPTITGFWTGADIEARLAAGTSSEEAAASQRANRVNDKQRLLEALFRANLLPAEYEHNAALMPELTGELHCAIMGYLAETPAAFWLVNQEDLTKEPAQQNLPGTTAEYPNWSCKMRFSLEELRTVPEARDCAVMIRNWALQRENAVAGL